MIKAAFFDIDGTLLSHVTKGVPKSAVDAVKALREKGIPCLVATGRHYPEMPRLPLGGLKFDGYIMLNGQLCMGTDGKPFWANPIEGEALKHILEVFHQDDICLMLIEQDTMYLNFVNDHVVKTQASISTPVAPVGEYSGKPIYQAIAYVEKGGEAAFQGRVPGCSITRWFDHAMDIICESGGKVAGMQAYMDQHGIKRNEIIAFGDGINDVDMLRFAGIGVAMGNGCQEAKEAADFVTDDIDNDGLAKALAHFGLISGNTLRNL